MARTRQTARKSTGGKAPRKCPASASKKRKRSRSPAPAASPTTSTPTSATTAVSVAADDDDDFVSEEEEQETTTNETDPTAKVDVDDSYVVEKCFNSHFFETGSEKEKVFSPFVSLAREGPEDFWMCVNFNSKFDGAGIRTHGRPSLNLVVALDVSGSMGCEFQGETKGNRGSKLDVAKAALKSILAQLKDGDMFGLVVFEEEASVVQDVTLWQETNTKKLEQDIARLRPGGGTSVSAAVATATSALTKALSENANSSNRMFFLTDMEVSTDDGRTFVSHLKGNAQQSMWATVVGIGLDLGSEVITQVSKTIGANYCTVQSASDFQQLMNQEFGYLVCPIGFNICMELGSAGALEWVEGHGTPEISGIKAGERVNISTEFPSVQNEKGERKPGPMLFKLAKKLGADPAVTATKLTIKHETLRGLMNTHSEELKFQDASATEPYYQNSGIRKAVLLVKYASLVHAYTSDFGVEERKKPLKRRLKEFSVFFAKEMHILQDDTLNEELSLLKRMYISLGGNDLKITALLASVSPAADKPAPTTGIEATTTTATTTTESSTSTTPSTAPPASTERDEALCVVCWVDKKKVCCIPCKHVCMCQKCSKIVDVCPMCRAGISSTLEVFI